MLPGRERCVCVCGGVGKRGEKDTRVKKGKKATEAERRHCDYYGMEAASHINTDSTCKMWL